MVKVHSVNHRGSDEYSVHIVDRRGPRVVLIFRKGDRKANRANALSHAREVARLNGYRFVMSHGLSARRFATLLPRLAQ